MATIYVITVGNNFNNETETVKSDSYEDCYDLATEAAQEMLEGLKNEYGKLEEYDVDAFSIEDDITFTEDVEDTSDFFDEEYYRCK